MQKTMPDISKDFKDTRKTENQAPNTHINSHTKPKTFEKRLQFPAFFPDATYSSISHVPLYLLENTLKGVVITTLHAHAHGLDALLEALNMNFGEFVRLPNNAIVLSDSGGFQVLSLIHNKKLGKITPEHAIFKYPKDGRKIILSPETSQQIQHNLGTDIRVVLDYPIMGDEDLRTAEKSVKITITWAKRAKKEFLSLLKLKKAQFQQTAPTWERPDTIQFNRPLLTAVVQGGNYKKLRQENAAELKKIGFDIYGFGGWPLKDGKLNTDLLEHFLTIIPSDSIAYAMGLGTPDDIVTLVYMGYHLFDCTIPTRNARHGTIFVTKGTGEPAGTHYDVLHIKSSRYTYDQSPLDPNCNCPVCQKYSRSYIRFLQKAKNPVGAILASIHNVYWYSTFTNRLQLHSQAITPQQNHPNSHTPNPPALLQHPPQAQNRDDQLTTTENLASTPTIHDTHHDSPTSVTAPKQHWLEIYHDATCKIPNAHLKGHSGKGPASCGFYIKLMPEDKILATKSQKFKNAMTIPEAEFRCLILALQTAYTLLQSDTSAHLPHIHLIKTFTDSQLLAYWINGKYRIKKAHIRELFAQYTNMVKNLNKLGITVQVRWHRRSNKQAQLADSLANMSAAKDER